MKSLVLYSVAIYLSMFVACENPPGKRSIPIKENSDTTHGGSQASEKHLNIAVDFVNIEIDSLFFVPQMVYASDSNFTHQTLYPCTKCLLRPEVATALLKAQEEAIKNSFRIVIFDCYRPFSVQKRMYEIENNPDYVAKPTKGSMHNKGCAVDIGLADMNGNLLDMGSKFDEFSEKAFFSYSKLTAVQSKNRMFLRELMKKNGFTPYEKEWWHFNFNSVSYPTCDSMWKCE